jgi:hypothetical protein
VLGGAVTTLRAWSLERPQPARASLTRAA